MTDFFRFPHTPHLAWIGPGSPRGDKILTQSEANEFLTHFVIVEEKVDGANLGISYNEHREIILQNRGSYLSAPYRGQFSRLTSWIDHRAEDLSKILPPDKILFGEWCAAKHSLLYDRLPDWFLLFDVYCSSKKIFLGAAHRDAIARTARLSRVPEIARGRFTLGQLTDILLNGRSKFRDGTIEGLVIRREVGGLTVGRGKFVRPDFSQAILEHWSSRPLVWNSVA